MALETGRTSGRAVIAAMFVAIAVGCDWGLPGPDSWAPDSISPRSCGLGAIVETYLPGHWHHYPPLQMAILTIVSLPWIAIAAAHVGTNAGALGAELLHPLYMTGIEACARAVTAAMAIAIVVSTMRLWSRIGGSRRAGVAAGAIAATNATLVYYAHTGNLEVPYLFWIAWGLLELDRVAAGEPREKQVLLIAAASVLTKDQAAAAWILPLPLYLAIVPRLARGAPVVRKPLVVAAVAAVALYAIVSGALVNPSGFAARIRTDVLGSGEAWASYPRGAAGVAALARDALLRTPEFASWPIAAAAIAGVGMVVVEMRELGRARALMPLVAAVSFTLVFNVGARRSEARFLLPQSLLLLPYAAVAFDRASSRWRRATVFAGAVALAGSVVGVASVDATLVADPRYQTERWLASLPAGARVEVYGGPHFLPRIPSKLVAVRAGVDPVADRQPIHGITDVVDPALDPRSRAPDAIVLSAELSNEAATEFHGIPRFGLVAYHDEQSAKTLRGLYDGSLGYTLVRRARCDLPWPLECRRIHDATAGQSWIYAPIAR